MTTSLKTQDEIFCHHFMELVKTIAQLRHPEKGCPWDLKQTHESLLPYLIEEAYEYIYAVENQTPKEQLEELGDVLLQVVLNAQIAQDKKSYNLANVCQVITQKLIHRHPHVFEQGHCSLTENQVKENWKKLKSQENKQTFSQSLLKNPALFSSFKIGQKAKDVDFDWEEPGQVWSKVQEEFQEVEQAIHMKNHELIKEEIGDLFFSLSQYCRHIGEDPENLARAANKKFLNRVQECEDLALKNQTSFSELTKSEKENLWNKVKKNEKMAAVKQS